MSKTIANACLLAVIGLLGAFMGAARADIFELKQGGRIVGELVDRGETGEYVLQSPSGAMVTLTRGQIAHVKRQDKVELEYAERSRRMPDTVESHRQLVRWCKEHKLSKQVDHHQRQILAIDPEDKQARLSLGYQRHRGHWMTRDEIMQSRGLILYKGEYRTAQDIALREKKAKRESAEAKWFRQIRTWRLWLNDPRRTQQAVDAIEAIRDPRAAVAINRHLEREEDQAVRDLLVATLAELDHPAAVLTLVDLSLADPLHEVRMECLDLLLARGNPIRLTPYVNALDQRHYSNEIINRAAEALKIIGNPAAISPLIDALVTTHRYRNTDARPGELSASFSPSGQGNGLGGGGGLSLGGGPKVLEVHRKNVDARHALIELSGGQNFEFDETAWRRWYINEQIQEFVDTRRDQ